MENMGKVLENIFKHILRNDLQMIIAVAIIIVVIFLLWLIMRAPRLWYWKTKDRINVLKSIEERLDYIENKGEHDNREFVKVIPKEESDDIQNMKIQPKEEDNDLTKTKFAENEKFVGKSGKIYTRQDLESKIKN